MNLADRIRGLQFVDTTELIPNPKNWRLHPEYQREALLTVLDEVGIADAALARETPEGLMLIDGHLRQEEIDGKIPVLVLDLTEEEADYLLATLDPLANMAERDSSAFRKLAESVAPETQEFDDLLNDLGMRWANEALQEEAEEQGEKTNQFGLIELKRVRVRDAGELVKRIQAAVPDLEVRSF